MDVLGERALNRALLARQGLLEPLAGGVGEVVGAVGALQMQYWPALGPALWSRMAGVEPDAGFRAHADGAVLTGTLLRGTIHTVAAGQYGAYAAVAAASRVAQWRAGGDPGPGVGELLAVLRERGTSARPVAELVEIVEKWVADHPGAVSEAEAAAQRQYKWFGLMIRAGFVRVPADGVWSPKTPAHFLLSPVVDRPVLDEALKSVIRLHLAAFGPAAAEDVAHWIGWNITPVRAALRQMTELLQFSDESGRTLYDHPDSPRPGPDTPAPVRLLPWFDSTLLAYAPGHRTRLLPEPYRDSVYVKVNGQIRPTFLVDGMVAGTWSLAATRRTATLTLTPLQPIPPATRRKLTTEAERLTAFCHPEAGDHQVILESQ
ncbi:winged helix DNA-binding domain-containing protein [Acrocarpospora catenulata]|uniref:winged helix DNA-binding domain-containing protein n=1 Tax=Acrocarpospora catenulata TaxID=2836182 RepID=UPI001BDA560A|nr:winged helix DNA-binding domain-containing protein [Acrocarpospora catenulata]